MAGQSGQTGSTTGAGSTRRRKQLEWSGRVNAKIEGRNATRFLQADQGSTAKNTSWKHDLSADAPTSWPCLQTERDFFKLQGSGARLGNKPPGLGSPSVNPPQKNEPRWNTCELEQTSSSTLVYAVEEIQRTCPSAPSGTASHVDHELPHRREATWDRQKVYLNT